MKISNIPEIKAAANIVQIIGETVKLKKTPSDHFGRCPFHNDSSPSFHVKDNRYKCFGCGKSGDAIDFIMESQNKNYIQAIKILAARYHIQVQEENKEHIKPVPRLEKLPAATIEYFEKRGISNNTLLRFNITETTEWMPKANKETRAICFNYYKDEQLINIKFRSKDKDFKLAKDAELIFYNLDSIKDEDAAVIVEGEIDCLSAHEAGIYNVVSVPNGAATGQLQLKYLDNCWQAFEGKTKIIIATDNDPPGILLRDELARRLGKDRCYKIEYPKDCKDLNEVLVGYGKMAVEMIITSAKQWPVEGVLTMDDLLQQVQEFYDNGYPEGFTAGIGEFDDLLRFSGGQLTTVTGSPGSGKSEFIDYITTALARKYRWKFGVCSFENPPAIHVTRLMEKFVGLSFNFRKDAAHRMNKSEFDEGIALVDLYFQFFNISQSDVTIQGILSKMYELVLRTGIKGVIIDPWNYIEHKVPEGQTETQYISESLTLIKEFAVRTDTHVFLVAHPKKLVKGTDKQYPVATMYDIAGSAHFFNKTDNGLSLHRDFANNIVTAYVQKVRFSWLGKIGYTSFSFDTFTRQYIQV